MKIKAYCYLSTQYKRHGVKTEADKKAASSSVRGQLLKFTKDYKSKESDGSKVDKKAHEALPYGTNVKGTNSHYFIKGEEFTLDEGSESYATQVSRWETFITNVTNIATRLEAVEQYDISDLKAAYRNKKAEVFQRFLGDQVSVNLNAEQKRELDSELASKGFSYYESQLMITIICDERIDSLSHCLQDKSTEDGEYVYHIKSKRVVTKHLFTKDALANLAKESADLVKLLPSKEATRFKTVLTTIFGNNGQVVGYRRFMEALDE
jgi:hypothetical protein